MSIYKIWMKIILNISIINQNLYVFVIYHQIFNFISQSIYIKLVGILN